MKAVSHKIGQKVRLYLWNAFMNHSVNAIVNKEVNGNKSPLPGFKTRHECVVLG